MKTHATITPTFCPVSAVKLLGIVFRNIRCPPHFTLLQPKIPMDGVISGRCDQPLTLSRSQNPTEETTTPARNVCHLVPTLTTYI